MKIEDIENPKKRVYSFEELPYNTPFVKDFDDETCFFIKTRKGILYYHKDRIWPCILDLDYFSENKHFVICTPKKVTTTWRG
jgi:hypothetical protein